MAIGLGRYIMAKASLQRDVQVTDQVAYTGAKETRAC